jgi:hypothetical protein
MITLPSFRRLPWLPGTFLVTLAAMIAALVFATDKLHTVLSIGALIVLGIGGGMVTYSYTRNQRRKLKAVPTASTDAFESANPFDSTETLPSLSFDQGKPSSWPRLKALMRAAPLLGVGIAFAVQPRLAETFFQGKPADSVQTEVAASIFALGFALGLVWRPYELRPKRRTWLRWTAMVMIITEWFTLLMLFTALFNGTRPSAIAPALIALAPLVPVLTIATELTHRRLGAEYRGQTLSGPDAKPGRLRALWRSGGARLVIFALGLLALAVYMVLAAPTLHGPSNVARLWPIVLAVGCALIPRGTDTEAQNTLS